MYVAVTVVLFDLLKELPDAKVQLLQNWLQPQTHLVRRNQRPQEKRQHCREATRGRTSTPERIGRELQRGRLHFINIYSYF